MTVRLETLKAKAWQRRALGLEPSSHGLELDPGLDQQLLVRAEREWAGQNPRRAGVVPPGDPHERAAGVQRGLQRRPAVGGSGGARGGQPPRRRGAVRWWAAGLVHGAAPVIAGGGTDVGTARHREQL